MESGVQTAVFYILAAIILGSGVMVVSLKNIFHSVLFLILCLFSIAGIYILLQAEFVAAVQVLIYVGAITVLMIFAVMLTHRIYSKEIKQANEQVLPGILIVAALLLTTLIILGRTAWKVRYEGVTAPSIPTIGKSLMTTYVLPFEVVSVVLVAALIGAVIIARRD